jgi:nucleotide-binding universal stress UspA family protein
MKDIHNILFPVDLSETSEKIVPYVETLAKKFDAEIHLLFVARIFEYFVSIYVPQPSIDNFEQEIAKGGKKRLDEFQSLYFPPPMKTRSTVLVGDASEKILAYTETENIDLLIMGTHGRKGLDKVLFGSVADRVSKMATVPVLLINPHRVKP